MTISATTQGIKPGVCLSTAKPANPFDGQVIYMTDVDQTAVWDGTQWTVLAPIAGGRNRVINGDFSINQRGFTTTTTTNTFGFDRWSLQLSGGVGTYSAQAFTAGAAPVAGYESINFARLNVTTGNDNARLDHRIEDVRTFAGQTVCLSFWAKGTNPTTANNLKIKLDQNFGSGGSATVNPAEQTFVLTGSWTRYSFTVSLASISGKTIGTSSFLGVAMGQGASTSTDSWELDLWGVQLEAGAVATPFEFEDVGTTLDKCQRYFERIQPLYEYQMLATGFVTATTNGAFCLFYETKRAAPSSITFSSAGTFAINNSPDVATTVTSIGINASRIGTKSANIHASVASGLTVGQGCHLNARTPASSTYIDISAEL